MIPSTNDNLKNLEAARAALNQLLTSKAETSIFFARHRLYKHGNKPGRLLACLAKGRNGTNLIASLKDNNRDIVYESKRINDMRQFYHKRYSAECNAHDSRKTFLDKTSLPSHTGEQRELLNKQITKEEVLGALHTLQSGKAPGPDGFGQSIMKRGIQ